MSVVAVVAASGSRLFLYFMQAIAVGALPGHAPNVIDFRFGPVQAFFLGHLWQAVECLRRDGQQETRVSATAVLEGQRQ